MSPDPNRSDGNQSDVTAPDSTAAEWIPDSLFDDAQSSHSYLQQLRQCGASPDLVSALGHQLRQVLPSFDDVDLAVARLAAFVSASRSATSLLALFERDETALPALLRILVTGDALARQLIDDTEAFDLLRASDGQPVARRYLVDELVDELQQLKSVERAHTALAHFGRREALRIAYGEFVRNLAPEQAGRQMAFVCDAILEAALSFAIREVSHASPPPARVDGSTPQFAIVGLGRLGGEELTYCPRLDGLIVTDSIDPKNEAEVQYCRAVGRMTIDLINGDPEDPFALQFRNAIPTIASGSRVDSEGVITCLSEAVRQCEAIGATLSRMHFVKVRGVAGATTISEALVRYLRPWVFRHFLRRTDLADIAAMLRKLERRAEDNHFDDDVDRDPGGRIDVERTVQFLQLLHGGELPTVRGTNTHDAIIALEQAGCVTHQEATLLADNYAKLCRLQHQSELMFQRETGPIPKDLALRSRLASHLGIRDKDGQDGDPARFQTLLTETLSVNRRIINHLMMDAPIDGSEIAIETELLLDPDPDPKVVSETLARYSLPDPHLAMGQLSALSRERVPFLSDRRCRHFFASLAPRLLEEISRTPDPPRTLKLLVDVTDSLGAKAMLWELLQVNHPTMQLMVRMCAVAPYLAGILTNNPGMIDELIDSLVMNRLPSGDRLDAQSIELCRGAADLGMILHSFKNSAHLNIGVRELLGKEAIDQTHLALSDTAEACLRRVIEVEQEKLASQLGDPIDPAGQPAELIAVALGKFGGQEPNYHSDLDVTFLYTADGQTKRRVGGPRSTVSNRDFFNQLARNVSQFINGSGEESRPGELGRLYELDSGLRRSNDDSTFAVLADSFVKNFRQGLAPLRQQLALCKARVVSGSRPLRRKLDREFSNLIRECQPHRRVASEIRQLRKQSEETASPQNLKRGRGGTLDVELIAETLMLQAPPDCGLQLSTRTIDALPALADAGQIAHNQATALVTNYRILRRVESSLRLMNAESRHELPTDPSSLTNLAYLMGEASSEVILQRCREARESNRRLFDAIMVDRT
ncbi:MAG: glutamate-ammonia-ligase adenylyltransferase [Planctomycetota bacterium]